MWYHWKLFEDLRTMVQVPMVIKGILTAEDAILAIEHGVNAVMVSNHGGRTLDYTPSSLEVLPEVVEAVAGPRPGFDRQRIPTGQRRTQGSGPRCIAVCLGRVPRWGLGSFGAPGVTRILEIVQAELSEAMTRCGVPDLAAINSSLVRTDFP